MSQAFHKDILRSIKKGWKRFLSILIITALGVGMMTGLYAASLDMYYSADNFFDRANLFDIRILSTLGLTQEDVDVLACVDGVEAAEGGYIETVYTDINGVRKSADMTVLSRSGINIPQLLDGALPIKPDEIAVTQKYLDESGKSIGDVLTITEDIKEENDEERTVEVADNTESKAAPNQGGSFNPDIDFDMDMETELEEETEAPTFANTAYTITGVVLDPKDIRGDEDTGIVFRSTVTADYSFFITDAAASNDIFSVVYIVLSGTKGMNSYSDEYEGTVRSVVSNIESRIKIQQERARYDAVISEAQAKVADAENTMNEKFAEADREFADAWNDIVKARQELGDGEATLSDEEKEANRKIAEARAEIKSAKQKLADAEKQLAEGESKLLEGEAELNDNAQILKEGRKRLSEERQKVEEQLANAERKLSEAQSQLDAARTQLEAGIAQLKSGFGYAWPANEWDTLVNTAAALTATGADDDAIAAGTAAESAALGAKLGTQAEFGVQTALGMGKVNGGQQVLDDQKKVFAEEKEAGLRQLAEAEAELAEGEAQIAAARQMLESNKTDLEARKAELADGKAELADGEAKLNAEEADARAKMADAWEEIAKGKEELADGEAELIDQEQEYAEKKEEAKQKLADAYAELEDIDMTRWYVQDRTSLESYSSLNSDLSSIEAVGKLFPIIFLLVAVLMSLTSMTRMVEEERSLIGTYKALGFGNAAIYRKYILFAFMACLFGGVLGDVFGFVFMPQFIAAILASLYSLPQYYLRFDPLYGVGGVVLFMVAIIGATVLSCRSELRQMPAALLRPKAPRSGSRVWLERIPAVWNRLKFLNKVTVRNLYRYKKRLFMTIGGIMGCTALIVCGFAIKDSVMNLSHIQYDDIYQYDLMAVFEEKDNDDMARFLANDSSMDDYLNLRIENVKLMNADGDSSSVQLMVIPDGSAIEDYIRMENPGGTPADLDDGGVFITENATRILGLKTGDTVLVQNLELEQDETTVSGIVRNYLGNNVYMTQKLYESLFGAYEPNGILAHLSDTCTDQAAYAEALLDNDSVLSAVSTTALRDNFGFDLLNAIILLLIVLAGGLAFVVLFTLSTTNISERVRELATIKVLGFYDKEVYQYVNKETLILTAIGVLIGLPAGRVLSGFLIAALNMPSIQFAVHISPVSYLFSAAITFGFAIIVNWMTNRTLDRINMVEALKSVE